VTRVFLTAAARADIAGALRYSRETFGPVARARYARLVDGALSDLADDPTRPGVRIVTDSLSAYHLRSSARRLPRTERVGRPRHLIVFTRDGESLTVVRVLDERMDIPAHLE
jgi:toxin ParE1/3/4